MESKITIGSLCQELWENTCLRNGQTYDSWIRHQHVFELSYFPLLCQCCFTKATCALQIHQMESIRSPLATTVLSGWHATGSIFLKQNWGELEVIQNSLEVKRNFAWCQTHVSPPYFFLLCRSKWNKYLRVLSWRKETQCCYDIRLREFLETVARPHWILFVFHPKL